MVITANVSFACLFIETCTIRFCVSGTFWAGMWQSLTHWERDCGQMSRCCGLGEACCKGGSWGQGRGEWEVWANHALTPPASLPLLDILLDLCFPSSSGLT